MTPDQVLKEFAKAGALLKGHFVLSSGLHSDTFLQKALVFQDAKRTAKLARALAAKVKAQVAGRIDAIVSPAVGGIIPGYEMGRAMGLPAMYVERENGQFALRRGFHLDKTMRVLIVEDIVTTGLSSRECIEGGKATGAKGAAAGEMSSRSRSVPPITGVSSSASSPGRWNANATSDTAPLPMARKKRPVAAAAWCGQRRCHA